MRFSGGVSRTMVSMSEHMILPTVIHKKSSLDPKMHQPLGSGDASSSSITELADRQWRSSLKGSIIEL